MFQAGRIWPLYRKLDDPWYKAVLTRFAAVLKERGSKPESEDSILDYDCTFPGNCIPSLEGQNAFFDFSVLQDEAATIIFFNSRLDTCKSASRLGCFTSGENSPGTNLIADWAELRTGLD